MGMISHVHWSTCGLTFTGNNNQFIGVDYGQAGTDKSVKWLYPNSVVTFSIPEHGHTSRCAYCKRVWVETDRTCPGCGAPKEE